VSTGWRVRPESGAERNYVGGSKIGIMDDPCLNRSIVPLCLAAAYEIEHFGVCAACRVACRYHSSMGARPPSPTAVAIFDKIRLAGVAVLCWLIRGPYKLCVLDGCDAVHSGNQMRTTAERDDARISSAFHQARQLRVNAALRRDNPTTDRDSLLTITATSKSKRR